MSLRELVVMVGMCLIWSFHFVVIKLAVAEIPPIFYAAIRMALVAAILSPLLRWRRGEMKKVLAAGLCLGCFNYATMFSGLTIASASAGAITIELYAPLVTILSVIFLKEHVGWRRVFGISLAFTGVVLVALGKDEAAPSNVDRQWLGICLIALAAFSEACGAILIKQTTSFKPLELLAWFALVGAIGLSIMSAILDRDQWTSLQAVDPWFAAGAILYSAIAASLCGHGAYYWLIQRLPVSLLSGTTLLTAVLAVGFAIVFLNEPLTLRFITGGSLTLAGVAVVLWRNAKTSAENEDGQAPITAQPHEERAP